jgi:hypothetical protein
MYNKLKGDKTMLFTNNIFVSPEMFEFNTIFEHVVTKVKFQVILKEGLKTFAVYSPILNKKFYTNSFFKTDRHNNITEIAETTDAYIHPIV